MSGASKHTVAILMVNNAQRWLTPCSFTRDMACTDPTRPLDRGLMSCFSATNGVDRLRSLRKIPTRPRGTNFCTSSARLEPSFVKQPNGPDCTQIVRNTPKRQFRVPMEESGAFVAKNSDATSWHEHFHQFGLFCTEFRKATKRSRMHPNRTKHAKMSVYGAMGWIGCVRCEKF